MSARKATFQSDRMPYTRRYDKTFCLAFYGTQCTSSLCSVHACREHKQHSLYAVAISIGVNVGLAECFNLLPLVSGSAEEFAVNVNYFGKTIIYFSVQVPLTM